MRASSRPETALFGNFVVRLRIPLCGVLGYASAEILVFLELAQESLVSASRTTQFPPEFPDGNGLADGWFLLGARHAVLPGTDARTTPESSRKVRRVVVPRLARYIGDPHILVGEQSDRAIHACSSSATKRTSG
jgi:hypothetical protein